jgi:hypothetical protein
MPFTRRTGNYNSFKGRVTGRGPRRADHALKFLLTLSTGWTVVELYRSALTYLVCSEEMPRQVPSPRLAACGHRQAAPTARFAPLGSPVLCVCFKGAIIARALARGRPLVAHKQVLFFLCDRAPARRYALLDGLSVKVEADPLSS